MSHNSPLKHVHGQIKNKNLSESRNLANCNTNEKSGKTANPD